jgi:hypothetical protein
MCHDCRDVYESLILEFLLYIRMKGSGIFFCMSNSVVRRSAELHVLIHGSSSVAKQTNKQFIRHLNESYMICM